MVSVALRISNEFKSVIDRLPWVNWSEITREEVVNVGEKTKLFEKLDNIVSKSSLTQEQANALADEVNTAVAKRYEQLLKRGE
ncbi:hypothetical protein J4207_04320 [Candidatus Woesearchaeota archaeon]|nr:hypothetical protein [Candidatus Woesearchaeota archaeon]